MKLPLLSAGFLLLLGARLLSSAAAAPIVASSQIDAVTVYADRAVITRKATLEVPATGLVEVNFEKLPDALLDESLQVSGQGTAQTTLLDVTARSTYLDFTPNERVKALEDELRQLGQQERALADRATVLNQQRDYVLKIQNSTTTPSKENGGVITVPETWLKLLTFTEEQLGKIAAELQALDRQGEDLRAKRAALEQQLNDLRGGGGRSYKTVTVRLEAARAGQLELTLRYTVYGASWTPRYDVRVVSSERSAQLGYFGLVRQQTGEDWTNIDLTLSTARPSLGGAAPELEPWIVQQQQIRPMAAAAPEMAEAERRLGLQQMQKARARTQMVSTDAMFSEARVETQATSASFKVSVPSTVPSDNSPQKVPITTAQLTTQPEYRSTPKLLPSAFLTAKVTNTSNYPLLAGAMNVFLDDTFVASSSLPTTMPGEKFDLALGADEGISVKRTLNNRFTEDTGLVTKSKRITYDFTLTVQNNKKTAETIVLTDQLPVSRHEKIVVKQLAPDERQLKPDSEGLLKWTFELKPGEKREIPLKFSVEHPNDLPVVGLE